jgi:hypothetical protein
MIILALYGTVSIDRATLGMIGRGFDAGLFWSGIERDALQTCTQAVI